MLKSMRSLTCVRDDITKRCNLHGVMSFWMQRKRNEESQTNSRGFLTYVRNDICLSFWGAAHRRISPQAYVMQSVVKNLIPSALSFWRPQGGRISTQERREGFLVYVRNDNHVKRCIRDLLPTLRNDTRKKNTVKIGSELQILPHLFLFFQIYLLCLSSLYVSDVAA